MNRNIKLLAGISEKEPRIIVGLMSGTSLDGLDIALCEFRGSGTETEVKVLNFETLAYDKITKQRIRSIFSKEEVKLQDVCVFNSWLGELMGEMVLQALSEWNINSEDVDCIASHGQTIYHAPISVHGDANMPNSTLQIADSDHIARKTGIITIADFRQKHTAAGGEGAPLAAYGDFMLFDHKDEQRVLLNIGGIGNFTYLDGSGQPENVFTTDTGPGNTLIDALIRKHYEDKYYDEDGKMASHGKVNDDLLCTMLNDSFFKLPLPKSTGPEVFNLDFVDKYLSKTNNRDIEIQDLIATLTMLTVKSISNVVREVALNDQKFTLYVSGGGAQNKTMMKWLQESLDGTDVKDFESLGILPDAKEAVLFALLANETLAGEGIPFKNRNGDIENLSLGKISFPH